MNSGGWHALLSKATQQNQLLKDLLSAFKRDIISKYLMGCFYFIPFSISITNLMLRKPNLKPSRSSILKEKSVYYAHLYTIMAYNSEATHIHNSMPKSLGL